MSKLDDFHYHEVLDRSDMILSIISEHLLAHPIVAENKEYKVLVDRAIDSIYELYQSVGRDTLNGLKKDS